MGRNSQTIRNLFKPREMKNPFKQHTDYNKEHASMDYRDHQHRYKVAAGFVWIGLIGGAITLIIKLFV